MLGWYPHKLGMAPNPESLCWTGLFSLYWWSRTQIRVTQGTLLPAPQLSSMLLFVARVQEVQRSWFQGWCERSSALAGTSAPLSCHSATFRECLQPHASSLISLQTLVLSTLQAGENRRQKRGKRETDSAFYLYVIGSDCVTWSSLPAVGAGKCSFRQVCCLLKSTLNYKKEEWILEIAISATIILPSKAKHQATWARSLFYYYC